MEKQIKIAAKLYECRDTAKRFYKDEYSDRVKPFKEMIQTEMKSNNLEEIPALLKISKTETFHAWPMRQMMFMAATVELIEPSF